MCRLCVADIREVLERLPTRLEREPVLQRGVGGDDTTAIDQAAEDVVVARLAALDGDFVLVSEELGERSAPAGRHESSSTRSTAPSMRSAGSRSSRSRLRSPRTRPWAT
jgi:fructose-1,6-bisphosphatase/inositol monophosphatase family enzyme